MENMENMPPADAEQSQDALLSELLQRFTQNNTATRAEAMPPSSPSPSGDAFSSLLSNPELISNLPRLISMAKPLLEAFMSQGSPPSVSNRVQKDTSSAPKSLPAPKGHDADRAALLCAMKPYLSPTRQTAIDYIIKLSRLGDILKTL